MTLPDDLCGSESPEWVGGHELGVDAGQGGHGGHRGR